MASIKTILGDAYIEIDNIPENSVDLVLTDPPYFLDKLDNNWSHDEVLKGQKSVGTVKNLPPGMKFSPSQSQRLYSWLLNIAGKIYRVLKPGGWLLIFSHPRLHHKTASACEDAGFWIRDVFIWIYTQNQPKAFNLEHFLPKTKLLPEVKDRLKQELKIYKVPKAKSNYENIIVAQKPPEGSLLENFAKYGVGLFNVSLKQGNGKFISNVITTDEIDGIIDKYFLIEKPSKKEKGEYNDHPSVKPIRLLEFLILLTTKEGALVLDPFMGSGTTAIACKNTNRNFIGIEINPHYYEISKTRLAKTDAVQRLF